MVNLILAVYFFSYKIQCVTSDAQIDGGDSAP